MRAARDVRPSIWPSSRYIRSSVIPNLWAVSSACGSRSGCMKRRVASEVRKRCSSSNAVAPDGMSETGTAALKHALTSATYSLHHPRVMTLICE